TSRIRVTRLLGVGRSTARMSSSEIVAAAIRAGALLETARSAAPHERPLRVCTARSSGNVPDVAMDGVLAVDDTQNADYVLAGRVDRDRAEYAWIRPGVGSTDGAVSGLPPRTPWTSDTTQLRRDLVTLSRIHGWLSLTSPHDTP